MDKIARIRAEIERLMELNNASMESTKKISRINAAGYYEALVDVENFLDTLSKEPNTPEFPETFEICLYDGRTPDKEKCTECSTTCSVRKEEPDKSLEEAEELENFALLWASKRKSDYPPVIDAEGCEHKQYDFTDLIESFEAGWKCRDNQMPMPEDTVLFQKGVAEGRRLEREDMMKVKVKSDCN